MGSWGAGEMGRWEDGEMGRWGAGELELGRWETCLRYSKFLS
ncbi:MULTISPECIES: hypothetical protein [unclassified Moorena]|nr:MULTISPECIES: hypothetical protein [unclassified Moorena]